MRVLFMLGCMFISAHRSSGRRQKGGFCLHLMPPDMNEHDELKSAFHFT